MAKPWYMKKQWYNYNDKATEGLAVEEVFEKVAENQGWIVSPATNLAYDRKIEYYGWGGRPSEEHQVDVKAQKRLGARDSEYCNDWVYIEFMKASGSPGWLYNEQADLIAFETPDDFIIVERRMLQILAETLVDRGTFVARARDAQYKVYRRRDREMVSLIPTIAVRGTAKWIWPKDRKIWKEQVVEEAVLSVEQPTC